MYQSLVHNFSALTFCPNLQRERNARVIPVSSLHFNGNQCYYVEAVSSR